MNHKIGPPKIKYSQQTNIPERMREKKALLSNGQSCQKFNGNEPTRFCFSFFILDIPRKLLNKILRIMLRKNVKC